MMEQISHTIHTAIRDHVDNGWEEISEWISGGCYTEGREISASDYEYINQFRRESGESWKDYGERTGGSYIRRGQKYIRQFNKYDGEVYAWKTKEEFYKLMVKYNLFPEY